MYNSTFDATNPTENSLVDDKQYFSDGQFLLIKNLQAGIKYTIVVTTYNAEEMGSFVLNFYGSGMIILNWKFNRHIIVRETLIFFVHAH